jgi:hypothetical protein
LPFPPQHLYDVSRIIEKFKVAESSATSASVVNQFMMLAN